MQAAGLDSDHRLAVRAPEDAHDAAALVEDRSAAISLAGRTAHLKPIVVSVAVRGAAPVADKQTGVRRQLGFQAAVAARRKPIAGVKYGRLAKFHLRRLYADRIAVQLQHRAVPRGRDQHASRVFLPGNQSHDDRPGVLDDVPGREHDDSAAPAHQHAGSQWPAGHW